MTVLLSWLLAAVLAAVLVGGWVVRVMWQASRRRTRPGRTVDLWRPQPQTAPAPSPVTELDAMFGEAVGEAVDRYRSVREHIGRQA